MKEDARYDRLGPQFRRQIRIPAVAEYEYEDPDTNIIAHLYQGKKVLPKWEKEFGSRDKRIFCAIGLSGWGKSAVVGQMTTLIHKLHPTAPVFHVRYDVVLKKVMDEWGINQTQLKDVDPDFFREVNDRLILRHEAAVALAKVKNGFVVEEIFGFLGRGEDLIKYINERDGDRLVVAALNTGTYAEQREMGIRNKIVYWAENYPEKIGALIAQNYGIHFRNQDGKYLTNEEIIKHYRLSASVERMNINLANFERGRQQFEMSRPQVAAILRDGYGLPPRDASHQWREEDILPWTQRGAYLTHILHNQWGLDPSVGYVVANPFRNRAIYMNIFTNEPDYD
jgi:hypothetical protein